MRNIRVPALMVVITLLMLATPAAAHADDCMDGTIPVGGCHAPNLNCGPGTVPGWLDAQGNPSSCVGDEAVMAPGPAPVSATATAKPVALPSARVHPSTRVAIIRPTVVRAASPVAAGVLTAPPVAATAPAPVAVTSARPRTCLVIYVVCPLWLKD